MKTIILLLALTSVGCQSLDNYRRTYNVEYDADSKAGSISMTLEPISKPSPNLASGLNDETIAKIIKLLEQSSKKDVLPIGDE